ncbi:MAG: glucose-6-phosphate isomerase [Planctomycetes bacterium]|nr:glucose-6-phosphate isomerase [Planctomycetota bacterium]
MALHLDLSGLFDPTSESAGRLTREQLASAMPRAIAAREAHLANLPKWRSLHAQGDLQAACDARAKQVKAAGDVDYFVVLGIGGSALGNTAMVSALAPVFQEWNPEPGQPRVFVLDNVDPDWLGEFFASVPLERTHINVISKSGGTIETSSQFLIAFDAMKQACGGDENAARARFTITTDPKTGHFRGFCDELGFFTLPVPDGVGGRFSVMSPVGMFTAAMAGFDCASIHAGAARVDKNLAECAPEDDPALLYALAHVLYMEGGKPVHVHFAYAHRLRFLADWYKQLWAESLGKRLNAAGEVVHVGPTPVKAVGPTDQHSQAQLYVEGPNDKVYTMLKLRKFGREVEIPEPFVKSQAFEHLRGRKLSELMEQERCGTEVALLDANRPVCLIEMCGMDAFHLGQYFQFLQIATAYAGGIMGIDPFDQPGVEAGKIAALALMGCEGFEQRAAEIQATFAARESFQLSC